jgi:hypothetical protein
MMAISDAITLGHGASAALRQTDYRDEVGVAGSRIFILYYFNT